jgi:glycine/D-amino acid oxidase-like deaminating enzyme
VPSLPPHPESLWRATTPQLRPPLTEPAEVDVAVVGAGITGMVTAVLAARAGQRVLVIEDQSIGAGATGFSTAKVTTLHGLKYSMLTQRHGTEVAARYARAQHAGLEWLRDRWPAMETATAMTYATDESTRAEVQAEATAAADAGLDARFIEDVDVPFATRGAVAIDRQGQIDPTPLLWSLADEIESLGGRVVENTRALGVRGIGRSTVRTTGGDVKADWVVVATGLPFLDRSLLFARTEPKCSYVIAVRTPADAIVAHRRGPGSTRAAPSDRRGREPQDRLGRATLRALRRTAGVDGRALLRG